MRGLNREKETCIFDFERNFEERVSVVEHKYRVIVQLAYICGGRWNYLKGRKLKSIPPVPPIKVKIGDNYGLIIYSLNDEILSCDIIDEIKRPLLL